MKTEGYNRESNFGSRRVADTAVHEVEGHIIEIIVTATFAVLAEEGNPISDTTASVAQVTTVTLTGTVGAGVIKGPGGISRNVIFNTSLTQTAADFVTDHAAEYATYGIIVTSSTADIIFTAATAGWEFARPQFVTQYGAGGDLGGTTAETTVNLVAPINKHGLIATHPVGEKIYADTKFTRVQLSTGTVLVY